MNFPIDLTVFLCLLEIHFCNSVQRIADFGTGRKLNKYFKQYVYFIVFVCLILEQHDLEFSVWILSLIVNDVAINVNKSLLFSKIYAKFDRLYLITERIELSSLKWFIALFILLSCY